MPEWEAVFLGEPKLYESADIIFRGQKCQTSHISSVEKIDTAGPVRYRVRTMSGGVYVGSLETARPSTDEPDCDSWDQGVYS
ncbi:MAG: hypothetical protein ABFD64_01730 [Armatimonadota bacterium]